MDGSQTPISTAVWLASFPVSFIIHFAEEFWGREGYPAYLYRLRGVTISDTRFIVFQSLGFVWFVGSGILSWAFGFPEFMILILSGFILCNGLSHTITAIWDKAYGPGLIASVALWIPLGLLSIIYLFGNMPAGRWALGIFIGMLINGVVALGTMRGGRLS